MIEQIGWDAVVIRQGPGGAGAAELPTRAGQAALKADAGSTATAGLATKMSSSSSGSEIQKAREAFTAMVLQSFLDAAVPKNLSGAGRTGAANTMWRSLLVEQLAKTVSASGQFDVLGGAEDNRLIGSVEASALPTEHLMRR